MARGTNAAADGGRKASSAGSAAHQGLHRAVGWAAAQAPGGVAAPEEQQQRGDTGAPEAEEDAPAAVAGVASRWAAADGGLWAWAVAGAGGCADGEVAQQEDESKAVSCCP